MLGQAKKEIAMRLARQFWQFVKATVIGGVFVLAPIVLLVYLVSQAVLMVSTGLRPVIQWLPVTSAGGLTLIGLAVVAGVIAVCFVAGLIAHTTLAKWLVQLIESAILSNLPGYSLMKSMGEGIVGVESATSRKVALVHFVDRSQLGFLMDETPDGRQLVFLPNVPSPWSGTLQIVDAARVEILTMPVREAIEKLQRLGQGMGGNFPHRPPSV